MYTNLGIHWASSIPAFLALACVSFPFVFYKYEYRIRLKCKYAAQAAAALEDIRGKAETNHADVAIAPDAIEEKEVGGNVMKDGSGEVSGSESTNTGEEPTEKEEEITEVCEKGVLR